MTKFIFAISLTLLIVKNIQPICAEHKSSVALRGAAFVPASERFRDIYGDVGANYQIEACTDLTRCLDGWLNANWFMKHGKSDGLHDPTRVNIANLSLGFKSPTKSIKRLRSILG